MNQSTDESLLDLDVQGILQVQHGARVPRPQARGARPWRPVDADRDLRGRAPPQPRGPSGAAAARPAARAAQPLISLYLSPEYLLGQLLVALSLSLSLDQNHH